LVSESTKWTVETSSQRILWRKWFRTTCNISHCWADSNCEV